MCCKKQGDKRKQTKQCTGSPKSTPICAAFGSQASWCGVLCCSSLHAAMFIQQNLHCHASPSSQRGWYVIRIAYHSGAHTKPQLFIAAGLFVLSCVCYFKSVHFKVLFFRSLALGCKSRDVLVINKHQFLIYSNFQVCLQVCFFCFKFQRSFNTCSRTKHRDLFSQSPSALTC